MFFFFVVFFLCFFFFNFRAASQESGWHLTTINVTGNSAHVQWPKLDSEIDQSLEVRAYIVVAAVQHQWEKSGRIVSSSTSLAGIYGLSPFREYQITVFAVDVTGQLYKSNEMSVTTDEGG